MRVICCFSFAVFNTLSLALIFVLFISYYYYLFLLIFSVLVCVPFWVSPVQNSLPLLDLDVCFLFQLGKLSAIVSSNMFSAPFSLSPPFGTPVM